MSSIYFFTTGTNTPQDDRINRDFDQMIYERDIDFDEQYFSSINTTLYDCVYSEIRNKLFNLSESNLNANILTPEQIKNYSDKYLISSVDSTIKKFKKQIVDLYNLKMEKELMLETNKEKYEKFMKSITESISLIESINHDDIPLKEILMERIPVFYNRLDLENLTSEIKELNAEYFFLKNRLMELSSIHKSTLCGICLENEVDFYINPCGHTLCKTCKEKSSTLKNCHVCRTKKIDVKPLYLSA